MGQKVDFFKSRLLFSVWGGPHHTGVHLTVGSHDYRGFENCDRGIDDFFWKILHHVFLFHIVIIIKICKQIKTFA